MVGVVPTLTGSAAAHVLLTVYLPAVKLTSPLRGEGWATRKRAGTKDYHVLCHFSGAVSIALLFRRESQRRNGGRSGLPMFSFSEVVSA